jgi:hypothetical protein
LRNRGGVDRHRTRYCSEPSPSPPHQRETLCTVPGEIEQFVVFLLSNSILNLCVVSRSRLPAPVTQDFLDDIHRIRILFQDYEGRKVALDMHVQDEPADPAVTINENPVEHGAVTVSVPGGRKQERIILTRPDIDHELGTEVLDEVHDHFRRARGQFDAHFSFVLDLPPFKLNIARLPLAHWQLEVATGSIDLQGGDVRAPSGTAAHGNVMENANDGVVDFLRCRGRLTAGNGLHALPQAVRQFKPSHQLAGVTELGQPLGVSGSDLDIMVDPLDLAVVTPVLSLAVSGPPDLGVRSTG